MVCVGGMRVSNRGVAESGKYIVGGGERGKQTTASPHMDIPKLEVSSVLVRCNVQSQVLPRALYALESLAR